MSLTVGSGQSGAGGYVHVVAGCSSDQTGGAVTVCSGLSRASSSGAMSIATANAGTAGASGMRLLSSGTASACTSGAVSIGSGADAATWIVDTRDGTPPDSAIRRTDDGGSELPEPSLEEELWLPTAWLRALRPAKARAPLLALWFLVHSALFVAELGAHWVPEFGPEFGGFCLPL